MRNRQNFAKGHFDGLLERLLSSQNEEDSETDETKPSLKNEIVALFKKVVSLEPDLEQSILDCGADSVVIVEFIDQIETKYSQSFEVEDNTSLHDLIGQIKSS